MGIYCLFLLLPHWGQAQSELKLFDGFKKNVVSSFTGNNIYFHLSGILAAPILIKNGVDAHVYDTFSTTPNDAAWPGAIFGSGLGAVGAGLWLYHDSDSTTQRESIGAAYVIAQSSVITLGYVTILKSLTGRAHPTNSNPMNSQAQSEQFEFGFKRLGVGYGWPSGHVSHTVAVTSALAYYYPNKPWLTWFSVGMSTYMLYTVSAFHSGQMHWFSDGIAGAFMGYAIGSSVGKNWRSQIAGNTQSEQSSFCWQPLVTSNYFGITSTYQF